MRNLFKKCFLVCCFLSFAITALAQKKERDSPVQFGLKYSSVFTSDLLNSNTIDIPVEGVNFSYSPGYSSALGAVLRFGRNGRFAFQTGLSSIRRTYNIDIDADSLRFNQNLRLSSFQLPFEVLLQVPINERVKMGVTFGLNMDFYPSDAGYIEDSFYVATRKNYWTMPSLRASFGIDFNMPAYGTLHFGASYQRMFWHMTVLYMEYFFDTSNVYAVRRLQGHYFSLDLIFFFKQ